MSDCRELAVHELLVRYSRCPDCEAPVLEFVAGAVRCSRCGSTYPVIDGAPVLIKAENVVFPRDAYAKAERLPKRGAGPSDFFPWKSVNLAAEQMLARFVGEVATSNPAQVLVIGSGNQQRWLGELLKSHPHVVICYSDVDDRASVDLYCDGHNLPFQDGVFHGVIASAVLEHVLYPERVIGEIHRVLHEGGLVYSEVPFMQQVHEGAYDFTRYTLSGHRRAFHNFEEVSSGLVAGPGTTLLWAIEHFCLCFAPERLLARLTTLAVRTAFFWLKYFDYPLAHSAAAVDGASCTYFLGRKTFGSRISDREIIDGYAGRNPLRHV